MTIRFSSVSSAILAVIMFSGCDCGRDSGGSRLGFEIIDAVSHTGPHAAVTLTLTSGAVKEVHTAAADSVSNVVAIYSGNRAGVYAARVEADRYQVWTAQGIKLSKQQGCGELVPKSRIYPI